MGSAAVFVLFAASAGTGIVAPNLWNVEPDGLPGRQWIRFSRKRPQKFLLFPEEFFRRISLQNPLGQRVAEIQEHP
jgi:hypothetical protein